MLEEQSVLRLCVEVEGEPEPELNWFHNETQLDSALVTQQGRVHTLCVESVSQLSAGVYKAVASSVAGVVHCTATVTVNGESAAWYKSKSSAFLLSLSL